MHVLHNLDAYRRPPDDIQGFYKRYRKKNLDARDLEDLIDVATNADIPNLTVVGELRSGIGAAAIAELFHQFARSNCSLDLGEVIGTVPIYEHGLLPGLQIIPQLLPPPTQIGLLNRLLHRDLSNPMHMTNIHKFYHMRYPQEGRSFFSRDQDPIITFTPKDPALHKPLSLEQLLNKKLRWVTLGGQYDWTEKVYPNETPPDFPQDVGLLLSSLFPSMTPQAAIVNLYSPGDTLSMHRDVAEQCANGLVSVSLGCEAVFVVGIEGDALGPQAGCESKSRMIAIRLRSGDALYMSGASRFAWHGVPQVIPNTCPEWLRNWPADAEGGGEFAAWKGWMAGKRINLNVRQILE